MEEWGLGSGPQIPTLSVFEMVQPLFSFTGKTEQLL